MNRIYYSWFLKLDMRIRECEICRRRHFDTSTQQTLVLFLQNRTYMIYDGNNSKSDPLSRIGIFDPDPTDPQSVPLTFWRSNERSDVKKLAQKQRQEQLHVLAAFKDINDPSIDQKLSTITKLKELRKEATLQQAILRHSPMYRKTGFPPK